MLNALHYAEDKSKPPIFMQPDMRTFIADVIHPLFYNHWLSGGDQRVRNKIYSELLQFANISEGETDAKIKHGAIASAGDAIYSLERFVYSKDSAVKKAA